MCKHPLYHVYLNGGLLGKCLNMNELHMCRVSEYGDPLLSYNYNCCKICTRLFLCIKDAAFGG
jgi:hypothetical protein